MTWVAGLLLVAAAVLALLTLRGTAWTATTITDQGQTVRTDLAGDSVVTVFDLPTQIVTTRLDGWGRSTTTAIVSDSGNPGIGSSGTGPRFGLGFVFGAGGVAIAAALLGAGQRWSVLLRAARPASLLAAGLLAGIWISGLVGALGSHSQLVAATGPVSPLDHHRFELGNSVYLGLAATVLAVAAAVAVSLGSALRPRGPLP